MAYGTDAGLTTYATARGVTLTGTLSVLLTKAHDYIESLDYQGWKVDENQADQWPRNNVYIDGFLIDSTTVPQDIIDAEYATAISIDQGVDPLADVPRSVKREKVGELETEYMDSASSVAINRTINAKLRKYLVAGGSGGSTFIVSRG